MKSLTVFIRAELEIPDDWELVEHPAGIQVLKIGDQYVDFDLAPLVTSSTDPDAEWSDANADIVDQVLDAVQGLDAELHINARH